MKLDYKKVEHILAILSFVIVIGVILYTVLGLIVLPPTRDDASLFCEEYNRTWMQTMADGSKKEVELPAEISSDFENEIEIEHILPGGIIEGTYLIFKTSKQDFSVYIEDELRKEYSTKDSRFMGLVSPTNYLFVKIGPQDVGKTMRVVATSSKEYVGNFQQIFYANYGGFWQFIIRQEGRIAIIGLIMLTIGLISFSLSVVFWLAYREEQRLASLSLGVIAVSVWIFANSSFRQLIFNNISVIGDLAFFMVMLIPIPYADYMNKLQHRRYKKFYYAIIIAAFLDFIICTLLSAIGICDIGQLFLAMACILFATILLILGTMLCDWITKKIHEYWLSAFAIVLAMVVAVIQVLNYMDSDKAFDISIALVGLGLMLVVALIDTLRDMLKIQKERNAAIEANETKSQFLANMSHEIRTPINAILGMNEMIIRESGEDMIISYARDVENSGKTLLTLVNDILDFSKIESGKMDIIPVDYDLKELIDKTILMTQNKAIEKKLELRVDINPTTPRFLYGDVHRLQQMIINLVTNGIKYTDTGYVELKIDYEKQSDEIIKLLIHVSDSGRGIKKEDQERLFDSFERLDEKKNRSIEGTGLGLAITKHISDAMGGKISVESKYGEGSCFSMSIPQIVKEDVPISYYKKDSCPAAKQNKVIEQLVANDVRIMAVDDVAMNLKVLSGFLKQTGIVLDTFTSGKDAIEAWGHQKYDLVIMDHMMPHMDGIECAQYMWENTSVNENVPFIMLTANAITGVEDQYIKEGFSDYLSKPYSSNQLLDVLCKYLPKDKWSLYIQKEDGSMEMKDDYVVVIDEEAALNFCAGNRDLFIELIQEFASDNDVDNIESLYKDKDWKQYQITTHALKGTAKTFGLHDLSEEAKEIEQAAKVMNLEFIHANHASLIAHYKKVIAFINQTYGQS